ncbi:Na/Pi symporter [Corynebacterium sp.]|uniref:Na/Pi symporter n=1 Tax=Corynebacterium sp. TaxID=1720 RepID=UPI0026DF95DA|nr:Na/Pi symporter [Corynebacterium sp.]MDO5511692.1 Na/Pi symporter [Corynebacterium sp.]
MTADTTRPRPLPGTQHFINPKQIPAERDFVALTALGAGVRWAGVLAAIVMMFLAMYLILDGAFALGSPSVSRLFDLATNPVIGLLIGIVATAALQSSTAVTALTVTAVGTGGVSVTVAIPVILGANLGTTITAMIVSFGYLGHRRSFERAFTSASLHTWFNAIFILVFFVLEMAFQPLQRFTSLVSDSVVGDAATDTGRELASLFAPLIDAVGVQGALGTLLPPRAAAVMAIIAGTLIILGAIRLINALLSVLTAATTRTLLERSSGASDALGVLSGALVTMAVNASSVTVSSLLPFTVARTLKMREALAIILGANVGTTLMSLLAALAVPGPMGALAVQAALVHVSFNVVSTLLVIILPPLREWIIRLAVASGRVAARGYSVAAAAMAVGYFIAPALIILTYSVLS